MQILDLPGRILFLSANPEAVRAQLHGRDLSWPQVGELRSDVSTDEMTPQITGTLYDERLGGVLLIAYATDGENPIDREQIRQGGFSVIVGGKRYGKGSSREHSPLAHRHAGIRLIVAESFERIFRQNCDNLGLFTSTDMSLIARIQAGEAISIETLLADRDPLAATLLRAGGLLAYTRSNLKCVARANYTESEANSRPMTLVEKILARRVVSSAWPLIPGAGSFVYTDWRFSHEYYTGMIAHLIHQYFGNPATIYDPATTLLFEDHLSYAHRSPVHIKHGLLPGVQKLSQEHQAFGEQYGLRNHGRLPDGEGSEGICHAMMTETYALPGEVVVGTDSHTPHSGALGCLAFGVGSTDMANCMVHGHTRFTVPHTLKVELRGRLPDGVTAKDLVLHLLARRDLREGAGLNVVFEFCGPALATLSIDERATLTNMVAEMGGFTGIVAPDQVTVDFLREVRGVHFKIEPWMHSDANATYADHIVVDCSTLDVMVAAPGDPGNSLPLQQVESRPRIGIAYGGSCTAGKRDDFDQYFAVLSWARSRGLGIAPDVELYLQYGTLAVRDYCEAQGYVEVFHALGAEMLAPGCGACAGGGPGSSREAHDVTVSAINRNFPGRSGPGDVWLANPATVAASAIAGELISFAELQARYT